MGGDVRQCQKSNILEDSMVRIDVGEGGGVTDSTVKDLVSSWTIPLWCSTEASDSVALERSW